MQSSHPIHNAFVKAQLHKPVDIPSPTTSPVRVSRFGEQNNNNNNNNNTTNTTNTTTTTAITTKNNNGECLTVQAHYSLKKAGLFLGIGMNNVIPIATDNAGHMVTSALDRQMQKDKAEVWAVVSGLQYDTIQPVSYTHLTLPTIVGV